MDPVNTQFAYTNFGVKFQHVLMDIIRGELNIIEFTIVHWHFMDIVQGGLKITEFTIQHQWLVSTLLQRFISIWPCSKIAMNECLEII